MPKLPFTKSETLLGRVLAEIPGTRLDPTLAYLIGRPELAAPPAVDRQTQSALRGADQPD